MGPAVVVAAGNRTLSHSQSRLKRTGVLSRAEYCQLLAQGRRARLALAQDKGAFSMANRYVVFSHGKDSGPWGLELLSVIATARMLARLDSAINNVTVYWWP